MPDDVRQLGRRSWFAFLGGLGLTVAAVLLSTTDLPLDLVTTAGAVLGVVAMVYGLATGVLVVLRREPDDRDEWRQR